MVPLRDGGWWRGKWGWTQERNASFFAKLKVTSPRWDIKWCYCHLCPPLLSRVFFPSTYTEIPPQPLHSSLHVLVSSLIQYLQVSYSLSRGGTGGGGCLSMSSSHWWLGWGLLLDWQVCLHHPFAPKKTQDTKHRKWREENTFEYEWYTTGAVNNWEVFHY